MLHGYIFHGINVLNWHSCHKQDKTPCPTFKAIHLGKPLSMASIDFNWCCGFSGCSLWTDKIMLSEIRNHHSRLVVVYQGQYPVPGARQAGTRRVSDIANGLVENGQAVELWIPRHFKQLPILPSDRFTVRRFGLEADRPTQLSRRAFWRSIAAEFIKQDLCGVIFYNTTVDSLVAMMAAKKAGVRVAYELCDRFSTSAGSIMRRTCHLLAEYLLPRSADLNVVISKQIQSWVTRIASNTPTLIVPGLVDLDAFQKSETAASNFRLKYNISNDSFLMSYGGSWCKHKGLPMLIESFEKLQTPSSARQMTRLVISGDPKITKNIDNIRSIVSSHSMRDSICLPGDLDETDIIGMISASNVVVSPSLDHAFSRNAFPTKVAEYAAMGKAIVATSVGEIPNYFKTGENALLCSPGDSNSMAFQLCRLRDDPLLLNNLEQSARITACKYFDAVIATKCVAAYFAK